MRLGKCWVLYCKISTSNCARWTPIIIWWISSHSWLTWACPVIINKDAVHRDQFTHGHCPPSPICCHQSAQVPAHETKPGSQSKSCRWRCNCQCRINEYIVFNFLFIMPCISYFRIFQSSRSLCHWLSW